MLSLGWGKQRQNGGGGGRHHPYLLDVRVEGHRHVQQDLPLLHSPHEVLDPVLELMGRLVDLFRIALPRLRQLLGCLQQFVSVGVGVLGDTGQ